MPQDVFEMLHKQRLTITMRMNMDSAQEYTVLMPAKLLCNWQDQVQQPKLH
jgi:hypothetical protein